MSGGGAHLQEAKGFLVLQNGHSGNNRDQTMRRVSGTPSTSDKPMSNIHLDTLRCFPNLVSCFLLEAPAVSFSLLKKDKVDVTLGHKRLGVNFQRTVLKRCRQKPALFNFRLCVCMGSDIDVHSHLIPLSTSKCSVFQTYPPWSQISLSPLGHEPVCPGSVS